MSNRYVLALVLASVASPALPQQNSAAKDLKPVSRAVFMQRVDDGFAAVDTNKDGFNDRVEIEAAEIKVMRARREQTIQQREAAFRQLDKDKNGSLSLAEFNSAIAAQQMPKANATPRITRLDKNKDGKISQAENRAPATAQFNQFDTNKDNIVSTAELQARQRR